MHTTIVPSLPDPSPPDNGRCSQLPGDKWFLWNEDCYKLITTDDSFNWEAAEVEHVFLNTWKHNYM